MNTLAPRLRSAERMFPLDATGVVEAAERRTGLTADGGELFWPGLRRLLKSLDEEAQLHFLGRMWARGGCIDRVSNALQLAADWERYPEILDEEITRPVVVVGMSRTGSTLLQHLLAVDPANRTVRHWEAAQPSPPPVRASVRTDPRIARAERAFRIVYYMVPHGRALHPMAADRPTECVSLLAHSFLSMEFPATHHVPSYLSWLLAQDMVPAYRHHRQQLQLLQWRWPAERWVLKAPAHLFHLDALLAVYPDACIVHLHRDPVVAVGSFCSLTANFHGVASDAVDRKRIGSIWPAVWADAIQRMMRVRNDRGPSAFVDVQYTDLVRDPIGVVGRIYKALGITLSPRVETAMRAYLAANGQSAHGVHQYRLEDFGLDREAERSRFEVYQQRWQIPHESKA